MRISAQAGVLLALLFCHGLLQEGHPEPASQITSPTNEQPTRYYWKSERVKDTAELLTLYCKSPRLSYGDGHDVPLVSVLRDTLGDSDAENDRLTLIWLLTDAGPHPLQRMFSAIPFFYWHVGLESRSGKAHNLAPLMDLSAPQHPMMTRIEKDLVQWTAFDPMGGPVRASTHAYRSNALDYERLRLDETMNYLRHAPASDDATALTRAQVDTVIARLQLRNSLLGGLVKEAHATEVGSQSEFDRKRIRSRNWELLRQWADKTGLVFEPLNLSETEGNYAILWFPATRARAFQGSSQGSVWKLLGIQDPWSDERMKQWAGPVYERVLNGNGPERVIPLAVYSLDYPKVPLLLVDFRGELNERRREVTQRSISELTSGVLGLSHFTNWYFYVASNFYDFVSGRHGKAMDEAARLECFSDFRMELALDDRTDRDLKDNMERRLRLLAVNPLASAGEREIEVAFARYSALQADAENGRLLARINQERRLELSSFGESDKAGAAKSMLQVVSFGLYKQQAASEDIAALDRNRRITYQLNFLDSLIRSDTPPEIAYDRRQIESSVRELSNLMPAVSSRGVRSRAEETLARLRTRSNDAELQADCTAAVASIKQRNEPGNSKGTRGGGRGVVLALDGEQAN